MLRIILMVNFSLWIAFQFLNWLFPRSGERTADKVTEWFVRFDDVDYRHLGRCVARLVTQRLDRAFGAVPLSTSVLLSGFIVSQLAFLHCYLWVAVDIPAGSAFRSPVDYHWGFWYLLWEYRVLWLPLAAVNGLFFALSLAVTREILRRASETTTFRNYLLLIALDVLLAFVFGFLTLILYGTFLIPANYLTSGLGSLFFVVLPVLLGVAQLWVVFRTVRELRIPFRNAPPRHTWSRVFLRMLVRLVVLWLGFAALIRGVCLLGIWFVSLNGLPGSMVRSVLRGSLVYTVDLECLDPYYTGHIVGLFLAASYPSLINLGLLAVVLVLRVVGRPCHRMVAHLLARIAETRRSFYWLMCVVLTVVADLLILLLDYWAV